MKRRELLKHVGVTPPLMGLSGWTDIKEILEGLDLNPFDEKNDIALNEVVSNYFDDFANEEELSIELAGELCLVNRISEDAFNSGVSTIQSTDRWKIRVKKTIETLNEYGITSIKAEWINDAWDTADTAFRYVPLLGSANELYWCACELENEQTPKKVEIFHMALLAFGIEVALFSIGAPYQMAWKSTRFVSNKTLLRLYGRGCGGACLSLAMTEIHWAIRGQVYEQISVDELDYIKKKIKQLNTEMEEIDWREGTAEEYKFEFEMDEARYESASALKEELRKRKPEEECNSWFMPDFLC